MNEKNALPELREIVGAIAFAAGSPVTARQIVDTLRRAAERHGGAARDFAGASEADVRAAMESLRADYLRAPLGVRAAEIADGIRLENSASCGPWVREFLDRGRSQRLSRPALETLAIIAYRQPVTRAEIESVRGVSADSIVRSLLDLQLIRMTDRSAAPGRPWRFGTTPRFLEHFGLRSLDDLPGVEELKRIDAGNPASRAAATEPPGGKESPRP